MLAVITWSAAKSEYTLAHDIGHLFGAEVSTFAACFKIVNDKM